MRLRLRSKLIRPLPLHVVSPEFRAVTFGTETSRGAEHGTFKESSRRWRSPVQRGLEKKNILFFISCDAEFQFVWNHYLRYLSCVDVDKLAEPQLHHHHITLRLFAGTKTFKTKPNQTLYRGFGKSSSGAWTGFDE